MRPNPLPSTVTFEFLTWCLWFLAFVALQNRLCRRYPGIRTLCRGLFAGTAAIALFAGIWALATARGNGAQNLAAVNHAFALGILAQTSVRSLFLVRWLFRSDPQRALGVIGTVSEHHLVASLLAMNQLVRRRSGDQW